MPLLFRCRKPDLPPRLVHGDGDRIGKIQRARLPDHGNAHSLVVALFQQLFGKPARLLSENEEIAFAVTCVAVRFLCFRREKPEAGGGVLIEQLFDAVVIGNIYEMPVIQTRPL